MRKVDILVVGAGGHALSCIDVIEESGLYRIVGFVGMPEEVGLRYFGYDVIASDEDLPNLVGEYSHALVAVGQIKTSAIRRRIYSCLKDLGFSLPTVRSPRAQISAHAFVNEGTIVMNDALINAGANVGVNCIINSKALIEHGVVIGDHCHISTGSIVNGNTSVGSGTFIGSGSVIKEGVSIGQDCLVGMGLPIRHDILSNTCYTG